MPGNVIGSTGNRVAAIALFLFGIAVMVLALAPRKHWHPEVRTDIGWLRLFFLVSGFFAAIFSGSSLLNLPAVSQAFVPIFLAEATFGLVACAVSILRSSRELWFKVVMVTIIVWSLFQMLSVLWKLAT